MTTDDTSAPLSSPTILHQMRLIFDQQGRTHGVAQETLERLLPLAQLLDLLNRPEDQAQDLGRELSETLKQIAAQMRLMRQAMVVGQEQGTRIEETLTAMLAQQAEIRNVLELLRAAPAAARRGSPNCKTACSKKQRTDPAPPAGPEGCPGGRDRRLHCAHSSDRPERGRRVRRRCCSASHKKLGLAGNSGAHRHRPDRRLASALCVRLGWPQTTPGWPFSKFPEPVQLLAADKETAQAAVARRRRSARLHWLDGSAANRGWGKDLLQKAMESKACDAFPETCTSPPAAFLVVTPACLADLRQKPRRLAPRLGDLVQEIPKAGVLLVEEKGTITVLGTVAEVLPRLRAEVTSLFNLQPNAFPGAKGRQLGPQGVLEQPDPGDDDPEAKGRVIAASGDEAAILLVEDTEEPEEDGFGPG